MADPTLALTAAIENATKVANTPLFTSVIDKVTGFKISKWAAEGEVRKKQIHDEYENQKSNGIVGVQYISALRSTTNLINTAIKTTEYIEEGKTNEIKIENDFFWGMIEHAKEISNEEIQELIAKILAGEYNSPGTYSMNTLQILKSLGKNDLEKFSLLGVSYLPDHGFVRGFFGMEKNSLEARTKIGLDYADFLEMQNLGLIQSGDYTISVNMEKEKVFKMTYANGLIKIKALEDKKDWNFPSCYQLTTAGKQIWQHLEKKESEVFRDWLKDYLKKEGIEVLT